ncbi:MAG: 3-oxoacyl-ACP synthase [Bacteroidota bacterium]
MAQIRDTLKEETKNSAGDKHETGRALLQLEREKLGQQLQEAEKLQRVMERIPISSTPPERVVSGSLVQTDKNHYYVGISAGLCTKDTQAVFCISPRTPIGQQLLGKKVGDYFTMNGQMQTILAIR